MKTQTEIETKFDVDDRVVVTGLDSIDGVASVAEPVEHDLDAEYFDTADLRLLRAGITLRRRLGGEDEGWHVKFERAPGERVEIHEPIGDSPTSIPASLRDLLVLHCRDAELVPAARVRNHRRVHRLLDSAGQPIAEVCDDHVTASSITAGATTWRELEVELIGGDDRELLHAVGDHLEQAGARPATSRSKLSRALGDPTFDDADASHDAGQGVSKSSTAGAVVAAYLVEQVSVMRHLDPAVRIDAADAVHQMRVAVRRLRSTLATYRRLLDQEVTEPIRDELKWLGGVLGAVRDAEVIRSYLAGVVDEQPPSLVIGRVGLRIEATTTKQHDDAHRQALAELSSVRYLDLMAALEHLTEAIRGDRAKRPARAQLRKEIRRAHRRMRRHLDAALAGDRPSEQEFHDVRKAAKRARYAAETALPVYGKRAAKYVTRMKAAQETLGEQQDSVVVRDVLLRIAADATAAGESAFTYGRMHAAEERRGRERSDEFLHSVEQGWARGRVWDK